jgi:hypothetical protein
VTWRNVWQDNSRYGLATVMLGMGIAMTFLSIGFAIHTTMFLHHAAHAQGRVLSLKRGNDSDGDITFAPVFDFKAEDGKNYTVESNSYSSPPGFEVGQEVTVFYSPALPTDAKINTFWQLRSFEIVFGLLGPFFVVATFVSRWFSLRRERKFSRWRQMPQ